MIEFTIDERALIQRKADLVAAAWTKYNETHDALAALLVAYGLEDDTDVRNDINAFANGEWTFEQLMDSLETYLNTEDEEA